MHVFNVSVLLTGLLTLSAALAEESPDYRLPPGVSPISQSIELQLDPASTDFSGRTSIALRVDQEVSRIGLYQVDLTLERIVLISGDQERELGATDGDWDMSWLADGKPIAPGEYRLDIEYGGSYPTDSLGMHRVRFEDNDYVFTQFEAMQARRAFPVFDEPSFKIPYQLSIRAPAGLTVISNTPVEASAESEGWQQVRFMQTRPLPSYLLAYAVGPLDRAPIEGMSVPGFIYTPKGRAGEVGFAVRHTPAILKALESYFGAPYHYRKLDLLAVPEFAFGAMENPGLVTFRTDLLMVGDQVSGSTAAGVLGVIAHELAHMWYGDLVTMAWWDDLWLNEAFASWMGGKVMQSVYPEYETDLRLPQSYAFPDDQRVSAKAIRKLVRNEAEGIEDLGLNYSKGKAILLMMEGYAGPDVFRAAIRDYLARHAWGNATAADLWAAITEHAGGDISAIAAGYTDQPGLATVSIDASGKVTQSRYTSYGRKAPAQTWRIPLDIKYKHEGQIKRMAYLLEGESGQLALPEGTEWVFPDAGANGYYRWRTDAKWFARLSQDTDVLSNREKIALLDNSEGLVGAGQQPLDAHMAVMAHALGDAHPLVALPAINATIVIGNNMVDANSAENFSRFVDRALAGQLQQVGIEPREGDSETIQQMRPRLLRLAGQFGADPAVNQAALAMARRYLADHTSVQGDLALEALRVSALNGNAELYARYREAYLKSDSEDQKSTILYAMYFRDPAIVREHLDFAITEAVPAGDAVSALSNFAYVLDDHAPLYAWLEKNLDALQAKIPEFITPLLPLGMQSVCDAHNLALLKEFFGPRGEVYAASLTKAVETIEDCIAKKAREGAGLEAFLAAY